MSPAQFAAKTAAKVEALRNANKPMENAVRTIMALRIRRIYSDGKNASGSDIGKYNNTKPVWIANDEHVVGGFNGGKTGRAVKTSYYKSYYAFKQSQNFSGQTVKLRQTNELQSDHANTSVAAGQIATEVSPTKVTPFHYREVLSKQSSQEKFDGAEARYGNVYGFTKKERADFVKVLQFETMRFLKT